MSPAGYSFAAIMIRAYIGGVASVAMGGQFRNGAIAYAAAGGTVGKNATTKVVTAAFIGGSVSVVTGGKFVNGAATGAFGAAVSEGLQAGKNGNDRQLNGYEWGDEAASTLVMDGASLEDPTVLSIVNAHKEHVKFQEITKLRWRRTWVEGEGVPTKIDRYGEPEWMTLTGDGKLVDFGIKKLFGKTLNLDAAIKIQKYGEFEQWEQVSQVNEYKCAYGSSA